MSRARHVGAFAVVNAACDANVFECFVATAHADCTLGEIADVLRQEFGQYKEPKIL